MSELAVAVAPARAYRPSGLLISSKLALRLLQRKPGASQLLFLASLVFAVLLVCAMLLFTGRIEQAIYRENASLLAADLRIESSRPFAEAQVSVWQRRAAAVELQSVQSIELASMLYFNGELLLARVLAVEPGYPLRGELLAAPDLLSAAAPVAQVPGPGEIWLDARAARQLRAEPGDMIELGHRALRFAAVLGAEPGALLPSLGLAGNALFNLQDLPSTQLIVPGSRANWYLAFSGAHETVQGFSASLRSELDSHHRLRSSAQAGENDGRVVERALDYLNLGAGVALIMAMIASLVAGQQFIESEKRSVAVFKALGFGSRVVGTAYALLFALWWLGSTIIGCLVAWLLVATGFSWLAPGMEIPDISPLQPMLLAAAVALGVAAIFMLPALRSLAGVAPQRLLRNVEAPSQPVSALLLLPMAVLLLAVLAGSWLAATLLLVATLVLALLNWLAARGIMLVLQRTLATGSSKRSGRSLWRLGIAAFLRQRRNSEIRVVALATTLALLAVVAGLRGSLLETWRTSLPADAPNYFAVNIPAGSASDWENWLLQAGAKTQGAFAVARGRLVEINGEPAANRTDLHTGNERSLSREFVITQSNTLPEGNVVVAGTWHAPGGEAEVSVEEGIAERLAIRLGDRLQFSFANQPLEVIVTSLRSLEWDTMQPNFYFILEPPQLSGLPHSYMGSFYLAQGEDETLAGLVDAFPELTLIDLESVIAQVERVIARASLAVRALAWLTVIAAVLVVATSLRASMHSRLREQRVLRALGASASSLRRIAAVELSVSGLVAGLAGCVTGIMLLLLLGEYWFEVPIRLPLASLFSLVLLPALLVVLLGELILRGVYQASPMQAWRNSI